MLRRCLSVNHFIQTRQVSAFANDSLFFTSRLKWIFHIFYFFHSFLVFWHGNHVHIYMELDYRWECEKEINAFYRWVKHQKRQQEIPKIIFFLLLFFPFNHQNVFTTTRYEVKTNIQFWNSEIKELIRPHKHSTLNHFFTFFAFIRKYLLISCFLFGERNFLKGIFMKSFVERWNNNKSY